MPGAISVRTRRRLSAFSGDTTSDQGADCEVSCDGFQVFFGDADVGELFGVAGSDTDGSVLVRTIQFGG